jgi:uncharacterized repeat protein (TIGR01451 family)
VLTLAKSDGTTTAINGSLTSTPTTVFLIQFFSSPTPDSSGFGQGKTLISSTTVQTDDKGNATFSTSMAGGVSPGSVISATATSPSGNTSEFAADITAVGEVNLVVSASAAPSPVLAGGQLTYTVDVANHGNIAAHAVNLSDQLPTTVTVLSSSITQGFFIPQMGAKVAANLGIIPAGGSATMTIVVRPGASAVGTITNSASATSQEPDSDTTDNSATVITTVLAAADLSVGLTASPSSIPDGSNITYTIAVSNLGPDAAASASAFLPLSSGVTFVSASSSIGTVAYADGSHTPTVRSLPRSATWLRARVPRCRWSCRPTSPVISARQRLSPAAARILPPPTTRRLRSRKSTPQPTWASASPRPPSR